jgi:hypothetical protein
MKSWRRRWRWRLDQAARLHFSGFLVDPIYLPLLDWCVCLGDFLNITVWSFSIFTVVCSSAVVVQCKLLWYLNVQYLWSFVAVLSLSSGNFYVVSECSDLSQPRSNDNVCIIWMFSLGWMFKMLWSFFLRLFATSRQCSYVYALLPSWAGSARKPDRIVADHLDRAGSAS